MTERGYKNMWTTMAAIAAMAASVAGGVWAIEARIEKAEAYADKQVRMVENETVQTIRQLRCDIIIQRLNELSAKERYDRMTEFDRVRRDQLRAQWQQNCGSREADMPTADNIGAES